MSTIAKFDSDGLDLKAAIWIPDQPMQLNHPHDVAFRKFPTDSD